MNVLKILPAFIVDLLVQCWRSTVLVAVETMCEVPHNELVIHMYVDQVVGCHHMYVMT